MFVSLALFIASLKLDKENETINLTLHVSLLAFLLPGCCSLGSQEQCTRLLQKPAFLRFGKSARTIRQYSHPGLFENKTKYSTGQVS